MWPRGAFVVGWLGVVLEVACSRVLVCLFVGWGLFFGLVSRSGLPRVCCARVVSGWFLGWGAVSRLVLVCAGRSLPLGALTGLRFAVALRALCWFPVLGCAGASSGRRFVSRPQGYWRCSPISGSLSSGSLSDVSRSVGGAGLRESTWVRASMSVDRILASRRMPGGVSRWDRTVCR